MANERPEGVKNPNRIQKYKSQNMINQTPLQIKQSGRELKSFTSAKSISVGKLASKQSKVLGGVASVKGKEAGIALGKAAKAAGRELDKVCKMYIPRLLVCHIILYYIPVRNQTNLLLPGSPKVC